MWDLGISRREIAIENRAAREKKEENTRQHMYRQKIKRVKRINVINHLAKMAAEVLNFMRI